MNILSQLSKERAFTRCLAAGSDPGLACRCVRCPQSHYSTTLQRLASALRNRPPPPVILFAPPVASLSFVLLPPQFPGSGDGDAPVLRRLVPVTAASSPTFHASPNSEATPSSSAHPGHGPGKRQRHAPDIHIVCVTCPGNRVLKGLLSTFILYNTTTRRWNSERQLSTW